MFFLEMVKLPVLSLEGCGVHEESEFISGH